MLCDKIKGILVLTSAVQSCYQSIPNPETGVWALYSGTQVTDTAPVFLDIVGVG